MLLKTLVLIKFIIRLLCDFFKYGEYYCEVILVIFLNICLVRCYFLLLRIFIFGMNYMVVGFFFLDVILISIIIVIYIYIVFLLFVFFLYL